MSESGSETPSSVHVPSDDENDEDFVDEAEGSQSEDSSGSSYNNSRARKGHRQAQRPQQQLKAQASRRGGNTKTKSASPGQTRRAARTTGPRARRSFAESDGENESSEISESEGGDSEEGKTLRGSGKRVLRSHNKKNSQRRAPRTARKSAPRAKRQQQQQSASESDNKSDNGESSESEEVEKGEKNGRKRSRTRKNSKTGQQGEQSDDDPDTVSCVQQSPSGRPQRHSARKASSRLSKQAQSDVVGSTDDESNGRNRASPKGRRGKKAFDEDDEDFVANDEEDEEEESNFEEDEETKPPARRKSNKRRRKAHNDLDDFIVDSDEEEGEEEDGSEQAPGVNIDIEQIGTKDDSSLDEAAPAQAAAMQSGLQEISPSRKHSDRGNSSDSSSTTENGKRGARSPASPRMGEDCPSSRDAITDEMLPRRHVCFLSPDGRSRQCFALSTLHKIATSAALKQYRTDIGGNEKQTFLQPPHFRSAMSDDLLDQIASRFGREALHIHGPFYSRLSQIESPVAKNSRNTSSDYASDSDADDDGSPQAHRSRLNSALDENADFLDQLQRYVRSQMGSQDLYVCPVCFSVAQARFRDMLKRKNDDADDDDTQDSSQSDTDEEKLRERYLSSRRPQDPMAVLTALYESNSREMEIASTFCRKRASDIKVHLREDHDLSTKNIVGNVLYARFKVRDRDGLLQRHLGADSQGDLQRYWFAGNNFDFVHLLCMVERAQLLAEVEEVDGVENEEAQHMRATGLAFFGSFKRIAGALWDMIAGPHRADDDDDLKLSFLANDQEEQDEGVGVSHRALDAAELKMDQEEEVADAKELVKRYEAEVRNVSAENEDDMDDESVEVVRGLDEEDSAFQDSDQEEDGGKESSADSDDEEDVDEWEQSILRKRRVRHKDESSPSPRRRTARNRSASSDARPLQVAPSGGKDDMTSKRRRVLLEESDDEVD